MSLTLEGPHKPRFNQYIPRGQDGKMFMLLIKGKYLENRNLAIPNIKKNKFNDIRSTQYYR